MNIDNIVSKHMNPLEPSMTVPFYLMASYAYYKQDDPILSDGLFDALGKFMYSNWDNIDHFHKHLITKDDLNAGTYLGEYPERVKGGLMSLRETYKGGK